MDDSNSTDKLDVFHVRWPHRFTRWALLRQAERLRRTTFIDRERALDRSHWDILKRRVDLAISPISMRGDAWLGLDDRQRVIVLVRFISPARTTELVLGALVWLLAVVLTGVLVSQSGVTNSLTLFVVCLAPILAATITVMSIITMARITAKKNDTPSNGYFGVDFCSATGGDRRATDMMTEVRSRLNDPPLLIHVDTRAAGLVAHYEDEGFVTIDERRHGRQLVMRYDR